MCTVGAAIMAMAGISIVSPATAGSQSTNVTVNASVGADAVATNGCGGTTTIPAMTAGGGVQASPACTITFGTNNGTSSTLNLSGGQGAGNPFMVSGGNNFTQANATCVAEASLATGEMGAEVSATGGAPAASIPAAWCSGGAGAIGKVGPVVPGVSGGTNICTTAASGAAATCAIKFAAKPAAGQAAGAYSGTSTFTVTTT